MNEEAIIQALEQTARELGGEGMYRADLPYVDMESLQRGAAEGTLTFQEYAASHAAGGFIAGMRYALEHIERIDTDTAQD